MLKRETMFIFFILYFWSVNIIHEFHLFFLFFSLPSFNFSLSLRISLIISSNCRLVDTSGHSDGAANSEEVFGKSATRNDDVTMLISQMHDLSFMLKSDLSIPSKSDSHNASHQDWKDVYLSSSKYLVLYSGMHSSPETFLIFCPIVILV